MSDTTQEISLDRTIHLLEQDLANIDLGVAINVIEQWENQFPGTEIFANLRELKQEILNANLTNLEVMLKRVSEDTAALANLIDGPDSSEAIAKIQHISQLLAQASSNVR